MYTRILVPVDGSKHAERILPWASCLSAGIGAELVLMRLVSDPADLGSARAETEPVAVALGARIICEATAGDIADAILWEASRIPGTLIAISSHGRSGALEALLGSVAMRILRNGTEPIMIHGPDTRATRRTDADGRIENLVVPLDGSAASETIVPYAVKLARSLAARLTIVSVMPPLVNGLPAGDMLESGFVSNRASEIEREYGLSSVGWEVLHGNPAEAIPDYVSTLSNPAIVMTSRGKGAIRTAMVGSVTAACLRRAGVPVFTRVP